MFNSVAFDVVIGLIFIFMLYSLLATVLSEIIATWLGLRARNLREGVDRMLNDEPKKNYAQQLWDSFLIMKNPDNKIVRNFYNHPEIKYLGSSGIFRNPSSFKAISFSKTLMNVLFGDKTLSKDLITKKLEEIIQASETDAKVLDPETAQYINNLWTDSHGDIVKFKYQLETWFDRTMEQATEWYKRKIQIVLLFIGFFMAWFFNADTFSIASSLSNDKDARNQIVSMANAYIAQNKTAVDSSISKKIETSKELKAYTGKLDSLLKIKKELDADIAKANGILGIGCWPADTVFVRYDKKIRKSLYTPAIDPLGLPNNPAVQRRGDVTFIAFSTSAKWRYFLRLFPAHFFGFLITAIAISLGAPFWFDLLNKLMKLRTSTKIATSAPNTSGTANGKPVSILDREG